MQRSQATSICDCSLSIALVFFRAPSDAMNANFRPRKTNNIIKKKPPQLRQIGMIHRTGLDFDTITLP